MSLCVCVMYLYVFVCTYVCDVCSLYRGIIPRSGEVIFDYIKDSTAVNSNYLVRISFLQVWLFLSISRSISLCICFYAQTHTTHNTHNAHVIISLTLFLLILVSMHKHTQHTTHTTHTCGYFSPSISLNIGFYAQTHTTHTAHMCLFLYFSLYWFLYVNETNMLVSHM